jgi:hypothetical protein
MEDPSLVQEVLTRIEAPVVIITTLIIVRVLFKRFLDALTARGTISTAGKETVLRLLDASIIVISFLTIMGQFIEVHTALVALGILGLVMTMLLIDKLREFTAYLSLRMERKMLDKTYEIRLPGYSKPLYGRVTDILSSHCIVEDAFGEKYMVPNTLMHNAVLKPHTTTLVFDVHVRITDKEDAPRMISLFKNLNSEVFRIDEKRTCVRYVGPPGLVARIIAHPISSTIRQADINHFMAEVLEKLKSYSVEIRLAGVY